MNTVDPVLVLILFLFALRGYFRGLFRESFSLLGLFLGFMAAIRYDDPVAALWKGYWKFSPAVLKAVAFVVLFFVVYFVLNLVG
ncbi:MAG: CvpA family protein, partial [Deltaproteobacteria bacterium]